MTALVAESPPQTPTPVSEAFVMVLVRFGRVWAAIRRLPGHGWGGEIAIFAGEVARSRKRHQVMGSGHGRAQRGISDDVKFGHEED